jgi:hypothetical protein
MPFIRMHRRIIQDCAHRQAYAHDHSSVYAKIHIYTCKYVHIYIYIQREVLDLMPSPTATVGFFSKAATCASPTINTKHARNEVASLMPSPTATVGFFSKAAACASPTINTKHAREEVASLLPSPTATVNCFRYVHNEQSKRCRLGV